MFAYVKSGSIVSYPQENRGIEIDGIKHSADIYTKWTESERNAIGIYTIEMNTTNFKSSEYYLNTEITYAYDSSSNKVTGSYGTAIAREIADKTVDGVLEEGLKTIKKRIVDNECAQILAPSDWMATKAFEEGGDVESGWKTWRASVRTKCNAMQTAINNASDVDALAALYVRNSEGVRPLGDFPVKE